MVTLLDDVRSGLVPVTCARDGRTHLATDDEFTVGREIGIYGALCGHSVLISSLSTSGTRCPGCREMAIERWHRMFAPRRTSHRAARWWLPVPA